jgi:hypothetical protein
MTRRIAKAIALITTSIALLGGAASTAFAATAPAAVPSVGVQQQAAPASGVHTEGIVPDDRETGYPSPPYTPTNDGEEVTTTVTTLGPVPVATIHNWRCNGITGAWVAI